MGSGFLNVQVHTVLLSAPTVARTPIPWRAAGFPAGLGRPRFGRAGLGRHGRRGCFVTIGYPFWHVIVGIL